MTRVAAFFPALRETLATTIAEEILAAAAQLYHRAGTSPPTGAFSYMDREQRRLTRDSLSPLTWVLGGCALAALMIAFFTLSTPRKAPRLNTKPGMTTGEQVLMRDHASDIARPL